MGLLVHADRAMNGPTIGAHRACRKRWNAPAIAWSVNRQPAFPSDRRPARSPAGGAIPTIPNASWTLRGSGLSPGAEKHTERTFGA